MCVGDGRRHRHDLGGRPEGRFLLGERGQDGGANECEGRKGPHELSLSDLQTLRRGLRPEYDFRMRIAFIAVGLVISLACSSQAQQTGVPQGGQDTAARVGDRTISLRELDDRWKVEDPGQKAQAEQAIYDGRKAALEAIIADMLVAEAAKAKNVTPEAFAEAEVGKRIKPVTDADVRTFYVQNSERMQGRSFEQMSTAIRQYLEEQQQTTARQNLIAELRKAGPPIRVMMDVPRTVVAVTGDDPSEGS